MSLINKDSLEQLKKARKMLTFDNFDSKSANGKEENLLDKHIETYEEFREKNKKFKPTFVPFHLQDKS